MSRKSYTRAFLAASSVLLILTSVSPMAQASDNGKSGEHGKADKSAINSILKAIQTSPVSNGKGKKFENDGNALNAQTNSLLKKLSKLSAGNPAVTVAVTTYIGAVDSATATLQTALKAAKTTYKTAVAAATTDASKQAAQATYKTAVAAAEQDFQSAISAASLALKSALTALLSSPAGLQTPTPSSA